MAVNNNSHPPVPSAHPVKKKRKGVKTLIAGVVFLILAGISLVVAFASGAFLAKGVTGEEGHLVSVPGKVEVNGYSLYTVSLPADEVAAGGKCTGTAANNAIDTTDIREAQKKLTDHGMFRPEGTDKDYVRVLSVTGNSPDKKELTLDCGSLKQAFVSNPVDAASGAGALLGGFLGMLGFGFIGLVLTIIGIFRMVRGSKQV